MGQLSLRNLWPLPLDLKDVLERFEVILIPEMNRGHLNRIVRSEYLIETVSYPKVQGRPFSTGELLARIEELHG